MNKKRADKRNERAERLAREVRYQMAKFGGITDNQTLYKLLTSWMKVAKKNKYERPN